MVECHVLYRCGAWSYVQFAGVHLIVDDSLTRCIIQTDDMLTDRDHTWPQFFIQLEGRDLLAFTSVWLYALAQLPEKPSWYSDTWAAQALRQAFEQRERKDWEHTLVATLSEHPEYRATVDVFERFKAPAPAPPAPQIEQHDEEPMPPDTAALITKLQASMNSNRQG